MDLKSEPHGQHVVVRLEDHTMPGMRLYEIRDTAGLGEGRLGFTGEELDWLANWWLQQRAGVQGATPPSIQNLTCLDDAGCEWEWISGPHDYHVQYDKPTGSWRLEKFLTSEADASRAHADEQECETLQDALLFSLEA